MPNAAARRVALVVVLAGACGRDRSAPALAGDAARGRTAIVAYGCGSCHVIPGVREATGLVGPPLQSWQRRVYIAGSITNTPANLVHWIVVPQSVRPGSAMPNLGVTERDARDMAAYLYTLR